MLNSGGVRVWDDEHKVPYLYKGDQWVGYDDIQSLTLKVRISYLSIENVT